MAASVLFWQWEQVYQQRNKGCITVRPSEDWLSWWCYERKDILIETTCRDNSGQFSNREKEWLWQIKKDRGGMITQLSVSLCSSHTRIYTQPHTSINKSWKVVHCGEWGHPWSVLQPLDKQGHLSALYLAKGHTHTKKRPCNHSLYSKRTIIQCSWSASHMGISVYNCPW